MKRAGFFIIVAFCVALSGSAAKGQVIQVDSFNYSTGQLTTVSGGNWVNFSGTGNFIQVSSPGLTYTSYPNFANKIDIISVASSAEDVHRAFPTQSSGTVYAAFLVNVTNTTGLALNTSTTGDYFAGFLQASSTIILDSRVSIRLGSVAGTYQLGLRGASTNATATFSTTDLNPGTTQLVVISYQIVAGASNDIDNMWINPALGGSEPAADVSQTVASDLADVTRFFVRQGTTTTPNASIDGLRVGTTWQSVTSIPTAANGVVNGKIADANGAPIAGAVIRLSGTQNRKTITDAAGNYNFDNVETNGFYTVSPSAANFSFSPGERSFSQTGNSTEATFTGTRASGFDNLLDTPEYFVRQHYLDFLGREPDEAGFNFWSDQILGCGNDAICAERRTINVSAAYFLSVEFQQTGGLVDRLYKASYGVSPRFAEFMPDTAAISRGVVVGRSGWQQQLAANKESFVNSWVERAAFHAAYDNLSNDSYVDALLANTGVNFMQTERDSLVSGLGSGTLSRAQALQHIATSENFARAAFNEAFVRMQYFGYLRRDPDSSGYHFWLAKLNQFDGNFERAEMVKAFLVSDEYRARFQ
jgi:hypothetical protein